MLRRTLCETTLLRDYVSRPVLLGLPLAAVSDRPEGGQARQLATRVGRSLCLGLTSDPAESRRSDRSKRTISKAP